jgi:hypothetical protein
MNNDTFERSRLMAWIGIAVVMAVPIIFIFTTAFMTIGGMSVLCLPFYAGIFIIFALFGFLPIIQLKTQYSDKGVEQPSFLGTKSLRWQDVEEVRNITSSGIILVGSDVKININLFLFKNPQGVLSEIRSRIPETAYPSEVQINREIYRRKQNDAGRLAIGALILIGIIITDGENLYAVIFGLISLVFLIYQIRNWLKYRSLQS